MRQPCHLILISPISTPKVPVMQQLNIFYSHDKSDMLSTKSLSESSFFRMLPQTASNSAQGTTIKSLKPKLNASHINLSPFNSTIALHCNILAILEDDFLSNSVTCCLKNPERAIVLCSL